MVGCRFARAKRDHLNPAQHRRIRRDDRQVISYGDDLVGWLSVHFVLTHCRANQDITPGEILDATGLNLPSSGFLTRLLDERDACAHQLEGGPLQGVLCTHRLLGNFRPA